MQKNKWHNYLVKIDVFSMKNPFVYKIFGNETGPTIIFLHGWPDDSSLWKNQLPAFVNKYRCVLIDLPNFSESDKILRGINFREMVDRLHSTIDEVSANEQVIFMSHDWGAYISYLYERRYPNEVSLMVTMDVGGELTPTIQSALLIVFYQWALISFWFIGGGSKKLGDWLTRKFAKYIGGPFMGLSTERSNIVESSWNYMYVYLWRAALFPFGDLRQELLLNYVPTTPILYFFGEAKPMMFHSVKWLELVKTNGGAVHSFSKGDHWFMRSHFKEVNSLIIEWFKTQNI
jgi:cis-3-alkyl-4-acyloxetan-2-one decarboxylase